MGKKKEAKKLAALAAREAELAAELERRKAAKKKDKVKAKKKAEMPSKKKGKGKKKAKHNGTRRTAWLEDATGRLGDAGALGVMTISAEAPIVAEVEDTVAESPVRAEIIDADGKTKPEVIEKRKKKAAAEREKMDAEIKARLAEKKAERAKGSKADQRAGIEAVADMVDRSDEDAVRAYNAEAVKVGATLLTSDAERAAIEARNDGDPGAAYGYDLDKAEQTVEEVATEEGRVFEAGEAKPEAESVTFAKPSDAAPELEEGRNGYKIIQLDKDGKPDPKKVRQLTRVTTFVGNIDDETTLKKWDKRMVVEGLAVNMTSEDPLISHVGDIVHRRDVAISKATKADRKGKLGIGEVGALIAAASKEAKDALDKIVEEAAEIAGRNKKARAGTHLHKLAEISDAEGIDYVRVMHEDGTVVFDEETGEDVPVTETDLASIEAYAERMTRLGAKVIESEAVIVNDAMGYAGRLDRIIMCRLPELTLADGTVRPADQRSKRYVADIKSGRVDLGAGKIARQLAAYALGDLYDVETGTRSRHSASRDVALVFHLPQGEGVCRVHAVDLKAGAALLKLSAEVRRARNTGKKAIDTSVDIADPAPEEGVE